MNRISRYMTRRNLVWLLKTNAQSWVIQGAIIGSLTVIGVGGLAAMVSAKAAAWVVFAGQCVRATQAE